MFDGATAMPFDPVGSTKSGVSSATSLSRRATSSENSSRERLELRRLTRSMSPPMLPSLKVSAIHGSNRLITRGHIWMRMKVVVQAVGVGVHQGLQPLGALRYCAFMSAGSMRVSSQVLVDLRFTPASASAPSS